MVKKFMVVVFVGALGFLSLNAYAQRSIKTYPSRMNSGRNYSYYRYYRRSVRNPYPNTPFYQPLVRRRSPVQYASFGYRLRDPHYETPGNPAVIEEEVREEFRTWEPYAGGTRIASLEDEMSDIKRALQDISERISAPPSREETEKGVSRAKIEELRKELGELKALLRELKERK